MMAAVTVAVLAGLLVGTPAGPPADGGRPALRAHAGLWGRIEAGFVPRVARAVVGEPVFFDFVVRNVGGGKIAFRMGGDRRGSPRHNKFTVVVRSMNRGGPQRPLPDPHGYRHGGGLLSSVALDRGQEYRQCLLLQNWADLRLPPGAFPKVRRAGSDAVERESEAVVAVTAAYTLLIRPSAKSDAAPTPVHVTDGFLLRLRAADEKSTAAVVRRFSGQCSSKDRVRRRNAYTALGMIRRPDAVDGLLSALGKANTEKRRDDAEAILHALNRHDEDKRVLPAIIAVARDGKHTGQWTACWVLTRHDKPESRLALLDLAKTGSRAVQRQAVFGLGLLKERRAVPILHTLLKNTKKRDLLRGRIAWALCQLGEKFDRRWVMEVVRSWPDFANNDGGTVRLMGENGNLDDARALARCLRDDTSTKISGYNKSLVGAIVKLGGPKHPYRRLYAKLRDDPNLLAVNRRTIQAYRAWAKP